MAFIEVNRTVQIEVRSTLNGEKVENVLYFQRDSAVDVASMEDLADTISNWWNTECRPLQSQSYVAKEVYATDLTTETGPTFTDLQNNNIPGAISASGAMPGNVAVCVSLRTAGRGRSARGRNYWCGLTEAQCSGNALTGAIIDDIPQAYMEIMTYIPVDYTWVVVSRYHDGAPRASGLAQPVTQALLVDSNLDSMRRRLAGRGQ